MSASVEATIEVSDTDDVDGPARATVDAYPAPPMPLDPAPDDVPRDMLRHITMRSSHGGLAGLTVVSADGHAFRDPLEQAADAGIPVQVLGFREHASWAQTSRLLEFIDLGDIHGVSREPLPRVSSDLLPPEGSWLQPFRPLSSSVSTRTEVM